VLFDAQELKQRR